MGGQRREGKRREMNGLLEVVEDKGMDDSIKNRTKDRWWVDGGYISMEESERQMGDGRMGGRIDRWEDGWMEGWM